ncbi:MAG TPA: replicative DNA helicase [Herpetosiphonaceae bacterium]
MEKSLPADINAERATLGSILLDRDAIIPVAPWLFSEYFYMEKHGWIYEAQLACYNRRVPPDLVNVTDELRRRERLDTIGGVAYLIELSNSVPTAVHIEYYGRIVERTALMRKLIIAGGKIAALGYDESEDLETTLDKAETELFSVSQRRATEGFVHIGQVVDTFFDHINQMQERGGEVVGLPSGFVDFDKLTGGLQRSDLLILAARPAVGKCLAWWTLIDDPDTGERVTIEDYVRQRRPRVYGVSATGEVRPTPISDWVDSGVQPCYRVRTRLGRVVDVTHKHPFLTVDGWVPLSKLAVGQSIAVPRAGSTFGSDEGWAPEQLRLLGYCLAHPELIVGSADILPAELIADATALIERYALGPAALEIWLTQLGAWSAAGDSLAMPPSLWQVGRAALAELLRALISASWCAAHPATIACELPSQQLAADTVHALGRFGIIAELHGALLRIAEPESMDRFQREIGWIGAPREIGLAAEVGTSSIWGQRQLTSHNDLYWDVIAEISPIGDHQVYDLTVPDGANFIAQDVCVHNTSFALNIAYNAAMEQNASVAIFSLEMSRDQLMQRILATHTGVDMQKLRTGQIRDSELQTITEALGLLSTLQIYIDDTPNVSSMDVRSKCRRLQAESGIDLVIIDYLQLMQGSSSKRDGNRVQEISEISRGLKALAREVDVPVIALSQLSRAVESRTSHVPMLSDLRESGCITGESEVFLPDEGVSRRIDSLIGQTGFNVLAINTETWKLEKRPVTNAFCTGVKPVFKLTTRLGRTIRATANHKFLTIQGWKRLDELAPGMHIATPRRLPSPAEQTMSDDELALLGHLIGDGCTLARQCIHYTTADLDVAELVAELARRVFGELVEPRIQRELGWYQVYLPATQHLTHGVRNPVAAWLEEMDAFDLRSYEKHVPQRVFQQPVEAIAHFMRHLWATDGCIWVEKTGKGNVPKNYYGSSSPQLTEDVQQLLLRLNITATLYVMPQDKGKDQHIAAITGKPDMLQFINIVGAVGLRKNDSLSQLLDYYLAHDEKTGRDIIPYQIWDVLIKPRIKELGTTQKKVAQKMGYGPKSSIGPDRNLSRNRALRISNALECENLGALSQSDIYWDKIDFIERQGDELVYDLTVDTLHSFITNNLIAHNSIEQDADIVMFIYREELYDPETDKKGIAELHLAKHRNGPTGVVPMRFFKSTTKFANLETYRQLDGY